MSGKPKLSRFKQMKTSGEAALSRLSLLPGVVAPGTSAEWILDGSDMGFVAESGRREGFPLPAPTPPDMRSASGGSWQS